MIKKEGGFSVYAIISIVAVIALIFILALPQALKVSEKANARACITNQKMLQKAAEQYMINKLDVDNGHNPEVYMQSDDKGYFVDIDVAELFENGFIDQEQVNCPEGKSADKYQIIGRWKMDASGAFVMQDSVKIPVVTVNCPFYLRYLDLHKNKERDLISEATKRYMNMYGTDYKGNPDELIKKGFFFSVRRAGLLTNPQFDVVYPEIVEFSDRTITRTIGEAISKKVLADMEKSLPAGLWAVVKNSSTPTPAQDEALRTYYETKVLGPMNSGNALQEFIRDHLEGKLSFPAEILGNHFMVDGNAATGEVKVTYKMTEKDEVLLKELSKFTTHKLPESQE